MAQQITANELQSECGVYMFTHDYFSLLVRETFLQVLLFFLPSCNMLENKCYEEGRDGTKKTYHFACMFSKKRLLIRGTGCGKFKLYLDLVLCVQGSLC